MKHDQRGIVGAIELLIVVLVVGSLGFVGYRIVSSQSKNKTTSNSDANDKTAVKAELSWQKGDIAVKGTYADSSVVKIDDNTWRIYYGIQPEVKGNRLEVYSSTSKDGKNWTQDPGTRKVMATFPNVIKLKDGRYRMYFQNGAVIKSAISSDGLTFTDESGVRIDKVNSAGLTLDNVAAPTVHELTDGTLAMVYRATTNTRFAVDTPSATTDLLMWATSSNGLTFTKKGIAIDSRNQTLRGHLDGPDLAAGPDGKLHVYVSTYLGVNDYPFDGTKFGEGGQIFTTSTSLSGSNKPTGQPTAPVPGETPAPSGQPTPPDPSSPPTIGNAASPGGAQPPGDPAVIQIKGTWFMYYGQTAEFTGIHYATLK